MIVYYKLISLNTNIFVKMYVFQHYDKYVYIKTNKTEFIFTYVGFYAYNIGGDINGKEKRFTRC